MEFSKKDMKILQGVAILFMLSLHLFARKEINGLYETFPVINGVPFVYYLALFGDACVPIYLFASGYGLFFSLGKNATPTVKKNFLRILKLLINFWIILLMFMSIAFVAGKPEAFSGGFSKFLLNFCLLSNSYNGAWWYLQTYVILVFLAPLLTKLIKKYNSISMLVISGIIYLVSYVERIKHVLDLGDNTVVVMLVNAVVLVGTSQLAFVVGIIFAKEGIYSKLYNKFHNIKFKNILCLLGILMLVVMHAFYESMIIAPFTAITFICLFNLMNKSVFVQKLLTFLGNHSTNLWLTHMFFYMSIFPELTFAPRYPILIFLWLVLLCLLSSFVINAIYYPIIKIIDKKTLMVGIQSDKTAESKISG
ncbi:acyltransferase family protein [Priestia megaterium]|uniref:acyltransferase family protein n=1 Tax=Priestia megaterium TaxID=1404 RepID=UPI0013E31965|nr:acyltransferase family protein [Priestia megaterium]MED3866649.1 acyltransferase family protein [Priestia megaterium]MED4098105.1 acyltransferase family protein [Priestia megaterium]MED4141608.1 acyltransferase family protein [Priestia megaterium]MED4165321.1 acyltransferase family protein [Priestia megaterium]MED4200810.1 acyltransferase family protein [Priestia megaterium]